jgi:type IV pilus assembly protein PilX
MVVLILLLVMTLLGLASLRGTLMEERMSANSFDRSLSFQAVEAALREGEARIAATGRAGFPTPPEEGGPAAGACNGNLCTLPSAANVAGFVPRAQNHAGAYWANAAVAVGGLTATPQYFIEYIGVSPAWPMCDSEIPVHPSCLKPVYRITARSTAADRARVVLQTTYAGT